MKPRSLIALAIVFVVLALAAKFAGQRPVREAPGGLKSGSRLFAGIEDFNRVARITIANSTQTVVLVKSAANKWVVESLFGYPADFDRIADDILNKFDQLRVAEARKSDGNALKEYGLDATATGEDAVTPIIVTMRDAAGKELAALKIGKERSRPSSGGMGFADSQFVQVDKGPVVLVGENLGRPGTMGKDWISTKLLAVSADQLVRVTVDDKDGKAYELTRGADGKFTAKEKAANEEVKEDGARTIFGAVSFLNAADIVGPADKTADAFTGTNWVFRAAANDGTSYHVEIGNASGASRFARIAVAYEKPPMPPAPAVTATNAAEVAAKAAKDFEDKVAKDKSAAETLNAQLSPWTFLIEESAAMTLALPREQVIGVPPPPSTNAAPATGSMPEFAPGGFPGLPAGFPAGAR